MRHVEADIIDGNSLKLVTIWQAKIKIPFWIDSLVGSIGIFLLAPKRTLESCRFLLLLMNHFLANIRKASADDARGEGV